jgi:hypothetical protein
MMHLLDSRAMSTFSTRLLSFPGGKMTPLVKTVAKGLAQRMLQCAKGANVGETGAGE